MSLGIIQKPISIQISITEKCNLKCIHCDIWRKEKRPDLLLSQWLNIITKLKDWLGPYRIDIAGGEPFIRDDLIETIKFCNKNKIISVVTTNATLLDKNSIEELSWMDNLTLNISLDGVNPQTHDYLRNTKGAYQKVIETLISFKTNRRKCHITLAVILMGYNIGEIKNIIKLATIDKLADGICFQALDNNFGSAYDVNWYNKSKLWNQKSDKNNLGYLIDELITLKKNGLPIYNPMEQLEQFKIYFNDIAQSLLTDCAVGFSNFIINPYGEVLLCWNKEPVGDILQEEPKNIWNSRLAEIRRDEIGKCNRTCRILNCNFLS